MLRNLVLTIAMAAWGGAAHAAVDVVATTSSMGMLTTVVGGPQVAVTVLAPPDRDAHFLLARPSMMIALRRAQLLVAVGADLEVGWLPAALRGANNPRILPGQSGYFEGAAQVDLIEKGGAANRALGDVHPFGNPHYYLDPERLARVGQALAARLGQLDPPNQATYAANAEGFVRAVAARIPRWREMAQGAPGAIIFHKDANYLAQLLGVPVLGHVEPMPGIPPTASHLRDLVTQLQGRRGVILYNSFHPASGPEFLARNLGWPAVQLQHDVSLNATANAYLDHIERWAAALSNLPAKTSR